MMNTRIIDRVGDADLNNKMKSIQGWEGYLI